MAKRYTRERLINDWEEFFQARRNKNKRKVVALMNVYPEKRSLIISFNDIAKFDADLADHLLEFPKANLRAAETAMQNMMPAEKRVPLHLRVNELPHDITKIDVRDLRHKHVGKLLSVEGLVRRVTEVRPRMTKAAFLCERCKHVVWVEQEEVYFKDPLECTQCHRHPGQTRFKLLTELTERAVEAEQTDLSEFVDTQKIEVQEPPENLRGGDQPKRLEMYLEDDTTGKISPGDRVIINGILRNRQRGKGQNKSTFFDIFLDVLTIEHLGHEFEEIEITPQDMKDIKKTASDKNLRKNMIASISPSIYGMDIEKEAIALQLFGGVVKEMRDGTRTRGDIHILLVGDPGTAKSQLLSYVSKLAPRGIYASGKSASAAGLTAAAIRSDEFGEGRWTLEAGALVLADRGVCCVDELDKMSPTDRDSMHTAMEQQQISVAKAGITATLQTRCAILAAANPTMGRFDPHKLLPDQIELDPPLLTRFDVIYTVQDSIDEDLDKAMADHITKMHFAGEAAKYKAATEDAQFSDEQERIETEKGPPFTPEFLRKYVAYAKIHIFPVMTDEAMEIIGNTYVSMRQRSSGGSVPMTPRNIEAMIRLAEANARMHLRERVEGHDAEVAVRVVMSFLERVAGAEGGGIDTDIITTGYASSQRDRIWSLIEIIKDLQGSDGADRDDIMRIAGERGLPTGKLGEDLERLKRDGRIYEKYDDRFRVA